MDNYETLVEEIESEHIAIIETEDITKYHLDGLWKNTDGEDYIFINPKLSHDDKISILNEEYGHYLTSVGINMDYHDPHTAKYEHRARIIAGGRIISLDDVIDVLGTDSMTLDDIARQLDVKPWLLEDTFDYFRKVFGERFWHHGFMFDLTNSVKISQEYAWA